ncbi:MAG: response regulator [Roseiflexaceae bacterium]|nr:response regulator [Roseiflexaceae bacterium]
MIDILLPCNNSPQYQPAMAQQYLETAQPFDIIVADDETAIATVIADLLHEEGFSVGVFHDGASALLAIEAHQPGLVLLDNTMPVMTGEELLEKLRQRGFTELPIVLMSAATRLDEFLDKGATEVIAKPFELDKILSCVDTYMQR